MMKMHFWNIQNFEQLQRSLNRWLDEEINDEKRIRNIERLVSYISIVYDNNIMQRIWVLVKDDNDIRDMMYAPNDIVLIVVIY